MMTERDLRQELGVPEDARFIHNHKGSIVGIEVPDGSFDYSEEGMKFLQSEITDESSDSRAGMKSSLMLRP